MIDEKKLIKDLLRWFSGKEQYYINHGFYDLINDFEYYFDAFEDIIKAQPKLDVPDTNVGKWIPVTERLPEENQIVMCSVNEKYANQRIVLQIFAYQKYWYNGIVEAWMQLPEPYKVQR